MENECNVGVFNTREILQWISSQWVFHTSRFTQDFEVSDNRNFATAREELSDAIDEVENASGQYHRLITFTRFGGITCSADGIPVVRLDFILRTFLFWSDFSPNSHKQNVIFVMTGPWYLKARRRIIIYCKISIRRLSWCRVSLKIATARRSSLGATAAMPIKLSQLVTSLCDLRISAF